jgi:glycosyltransferase involved in cell wall biosynthesis
LLGRTRSSVESGRPSSLQATVSAPSLGSTSGVSICMATYNGSAFIEEQVKSILEQLASTDELVLVDDGSSDHTVDVLERLQDGRIVIHRNGANRGHVYSFQKAIALSRHPIIVLADQDDRWLGGRLTLLIAALETSGAMVVSSNSDYMDTHGRPIHHHVHRLWARDSRRYVRNILRIFVGKSGYWGCAMAFRRELLPLILPMPRFVESHDLWIALASNLIGSNAHVERSTIVRRIHGQNASLARRSVVKKLRSRAIFLWSLGVLLSRYRHWPKTRESQRASIAIAQQ